MTNDTDLTQATELYRVPDANLDTLRAKIEKLNKRAAKLGCAPIQLIETGIEDVPDKDEPSIIHRFHLLRVEGDAPILSGWKLAASLDHVDGQTIVRSVPGMVIPVQYQNADPICEHCQKSRQRNGTFLLVHTDGRMAQVGRNCLRDFLGHTDPHRLASYAEILWDALASLQEETDDEGSGGRGGCFIGLDSYLAYVAVIIRECGWMSRSRAKELQKLSTSSLAESRMFNLHKTAADLPTSADVELAAQAIAWGKTLAERDEATPGSLSDYEHNLAVVTRMGAITPKMTGIAASMITAYQRATTQQRENAQAQAESHHFGVEGKREVFTLTVKRISQLEGIYGIQYLHSFIDTAGNRAIWYSSAGSLDEGKTYRLKATVKKHSEYKGIQQTELTRCAVVEILSNTDVDSHVPDVVATPTR